MYSRQSLHNTYLRFYSKRAILSDDDDDDDDDDNKDKGLLFESQVHITKGCNC